MNVPTWARFVAAARARLPLRWEFGSREALQGRCHEAATLLAELVDGTLRRGFYAGEMDTKRLFLRLSLEPDGTLGHSWVEKDGKILDPTWWAFTDARLGIYVWDVSDPRYLREEKRDG